MAEICVDESGNKIVVISEIIFKNKKHINWDNVEEYLKSYVGTTVENTETGDVITFGKKFPDEYARSEYTRMLKGAFAKAKANAAQGLYEMIQVAVQKESVENLKSKHSSMASLGWSYYRARFAIPVLENDIVTGRYNIYSCRLVINCVSSKKAYFYDLVEIKKEAGNLFKTNK